MGIIDLEHHIVKSPHRLKSGYAIRKYSDLAKKIQRSYGELFGDKFKNLTDQYIADITETSFQGFWSQTAMDASVFSNFFFFKISPFIQRFIASILYRKSIKNFLYSAHVDFEFIPFYPKNKLSVPVDSERFNAITKKYLNSTFSCADQCKQTHILYDQLFPATVTQNYWALLPGTRVVVVDRDPRDLYIGQVYLEKRGLDTTRT